MIEVEIILRCNYWFSVGFDYISGRLREKVRRLRIEEYLVWIDD